MTDTTDRPEADQKSVKEWVRVLSKYRDPSMPRSFFELGVTVGPLVALWLAAALLAASSPLIAFLISAFAGLFVVRAFIIQHDCGHGSFLADRKWQDRLGEILGVLTVTPYHVWKHSHSIHHSHAGDLDERGIGDVYTMTVEEYRAASLIEKIKYRIYRNPLFLFGLAPSIQFLVIQRIPSPSQMQKKFWTSALATNAGMIALAGLFWLIGGWSAVLLAWLPSISVAASLGVWLFYVQHQFEETYWDQKPEWDMHEAALEGSSHYVMPKPLQWMTGNIGIHHVHHLFSRIPFYRLTEVLKDHPELDEAQRLTIAESLSCARRHLWDPVSRRLLTYREAALLPA